MPTKTGVIIRDYSNIKTTNVKKIKKYRYRQQLTILFAGKSSRHIYIDGIHYPNWLQSNNIRNNVIRSISVHSGKDVRKSLKLRADFVFIAPVFKTTSHKNKNNLGVIKLGLLVRLFKLPVIALGGINEKNVSRLKGLPISGCAGIDVFL